MAPLNNVFVANPGLLSKIKNEDLRKIMYIGSSAGTPLEKKATFSFTWSNDGFGDFVNEVTFYPPNSDLPSKVFKVSIPLGGWYQIVLPVRFFSEWEVEQEEKNRVRDIVKRFEEAAKRHGSTQQAVALGDCGEQHAYETGKILKDLRAELYAELEV